MPILLCTLYKVKTYPLAHVLELSSVHAHFSLFLNNDPTLVPHEKCCFINGSHMHVKYSYPVFFDAMIHFHIGGPVMIMIYSMLLSMLLYRVPRDMYLFSLLMFDGASVDIYRVHNKSQHLLEQHKVNQSIISYQ